MSNRPRSALVFLAGLAMLPPAFAQTTISLREGSAGYAHVAALIRADNTNLNAGARDQFIVGKTTGALRAVLSFGLDRIPVGATVTDVSLDCWTIATNSLGSVGALELHALNGTPVEGTGDGSGTGAGTGVTWVSRDGQGGTGHAWTVAGGDFNAAVLSSVPGYNAALPDAQKTFAATAAFVAAAQAAVTGGRPLDLLICAPLTEAGANNIYSRIHSDDATNGAVRPRLNVTYAADPAPSGLVATPLSWSEVALAWTDNLTNEAGFVVERQDGGTGAWTAAISAGANATNATHWGLAPASVYAFRVRAVFADGSTSPAATAVPVTTLVASARSPIVVLPLGDSITLGASVPAWVPGGYRSPLFALLTNAGYQVAFAGSQSNNATASLTGSGNAAHEGHGGYATFDLLANLDSGEHWIDGIAGTRAAVYPDVILLMAGVNDLGVDQLSSTQGLAGLDVLLNKLAALRPAARIVVSTLTPYTGTIYPLREGHQLEFNAALPALVAAHQDAGHRVTLCDVRPRVNVANAATMLCSDGVHPVQTGYNEIAAMWGEAFQALPTIENWRRAHFGSPVAAGNTADAADRDGDGASNLEEYALGTDPVSPVPEHPLRPCVVRELGVDYAGLSFPRRRDADVGYGVEVASDLSGPASWTGTVVQCGASAGPDPAFDRVTVRDRQPLSPAASRFLRLRLARP